MLCICFYKFGPPSPFQISNHTDSRNCTATFIQYFQLFVGKQCSFRVLCQKSESLNIAPVYLTDIIIKWVISYYAFCFLKLMSSMQNQYCYGEKDYFLTRAIATKLCLFCRFFITGGDIWVIKTDLDFQMPGSICRVGNYLKKNHKDTKNPSTNQSPTFFKFNRIYLIRKKLRQ